MPPGGDAGSRASIGLTMPDGLGGGVVSGRVVVVVVLEVVVVDDEVVLDGAGAASAGPPSSRVTMTEPTPSPQTASTVTVETSRTRRTGGRVERQVLLTAPVDPSR